MRDDEYLQILADISIPENYDEKDRYNDFRAVFLETDQGRRVLKQILSWGHILKQPDVRQGGDKIDPYKFVLTAGERNVALRIFATMLVDPAERPRAQQTSYKQED